MGLFTGVEDAKVGQGGVYFLAGKYLVEVVKCFAMSSRKREDLFIVECMIHESNNAERPAGTTASWIVNFKHDAALGNIKGFIAACNGIDPSDEAKVNEEVNEEVCEYAVDDDNPLAGTTLQVTATQITTRDGGPFTLHSWEPVAAAA